MTNTENDQHNLVGYSKQQNVDAWMGPNTPSYLCWGFQFGILGQFVNDHFGRALKASNSRARKNRKDTEHWKRFSSSKDWSPDGPSQWLGSDDFFRTKVWSSWRVQGGCFPCMAIWIWRSVERSEALVPCQPWSNTNETSLAGMKKGTCLIWLGSENGLGWQKSADDHLRTCSLLWDFCVISVSRAYSSDPPSQDEHQLR